MRADDSRSPFLLALCGALLLPAFASAANLLVNPEFTSGITGWTYGGFGDVTPEPTSGSPAAGSIRLASNDAPMLITSRQCVDGAITGDYEWGGRIQQTSSTAPETHTIAATFYQGAACGGTMLGSFTSIAGADTGGGWIQYAATVTVPANTASTLIELTVDVAINGAGDYLFDHVYFGPLGTTPVELQGFTAE